MALKVMGVREKLALRRLAGYIRNNVGAQDWADHIYASSSYVAAALGVETMDVVNTLRPALGMKMEATGEMYEAARLREEKQRLPRKDIRIGKYKPVRITPKRPKLRR